MVTTINFNLTKPLAHVGYEGGLRLIEDAISAVMGSFQ